ncbi:uncharacterized protein LOC120004829 isoform X2 [Tripterygium wilfordii]|uniref:uncharacterized protein LOC120004829 isoform X2 n=1 Tax=Tripterygium wilfordii TaxID=458696 RepID=UPI0018F845BF|nr:uncharacterized protein LOC120004829 isoform X2 [Tripterygium wilfordii]XP_038710072.1 uncharacterized protein LOC120004829 isoform X2 [Tripterygium wilfordii]
MDRSNSSNYLGIFDYVDESLEFTSKDGAMVPVSQDQWTKLGSFQLLQQPGVGNGVEQWIELEPQHLVGEPGPSQYSMIPYNGGKVNGTADQDEKKKMKDRNYRERCKEEKRQMEIDLRRLAGENSHLKSVNKEMKKEKDSMNQNLQSAGAEINKLKSEFCKLKGYIGHQHILVEAFSQKIFSSNHVHEQIKMLRDEIARLSANVSSNKQMLEKKELLDKILHLQYQNKVLKVQVQALCEKISNEKNSEGA